MKIITVLILLILISYVLFYYYNEFYKFRRSLFFEELYTLNNEKKYLKNNRNDIEYINNPLFQTYKDKSKIPLDVYDNIKQYAPEYTHIVMDDSDILVFLNKYYNDNVIKAFHNIKNGAHKADLARYCLLYIYGGLYLDIKAELIMPIRDVFNKGDDVFYTVDSVVKRTVHQGIIKSTKNNPLFLSLIDYILNTENPLYYSDFCKDLYIQIENDVKNIKSSNIMKGKSGQKYYLFREECSSTDSSMCYDGFDRYGLCCFVWDGSIPVIKLRRSSYPWK